MALTREDIGAVLVAFEAYGWSELVLTMDGTRLELTNSGAPPSSSVGPPPRTVEIPTAAPTHASDIPRQESGVTPSTPAPASGLPSDGAPPRSARQVLAPSVGIFYAASEPGAPPFVQVGQQVHAEDIVCIVEVMKLMNHVKAGVDGVVRAVLVENGTMVEHGQPLFEIEPVPS